MNVNVTDITCDGPGLGIYSVRMISVELDGIPKVAKMQYRRQPAKQPITTGYTIFRPTLTFNDPMVRKHQCYAEIRGKVLAQYSELLRQTEWPMLPTPLPINIVQASY